LIENNKISYEKAVLIGIINSIQSEETVKDYLNELSFLAETAGELFQKNLFKELTNPIQKPL